MANSLRSLLVVPALSKPSMSDALQSRADVVVFDLAGGVPDDLKDDARQLLARFLADHEDVDRPIYLRVHGPRSGRMEQDVRLTHSPVVDSYVLPGVENASGVEGLMGLLDAVSAAGEKLSAVPVIGSVEALDNTEEIAGAFGVRRMAVSRMDLINDLNAEWDEEERATLHAVSRFVMDCRRAGSEPPLDSAWPRRDDPEGLRREAAQASRMGFQGKMVMAKNQISVVNSAFSVGEKEIVRAQKIVDAYDGAAMGHAGPVAEEGFLVDRPVYEHARAILRREGLL